MSRRNIQISENKPVPGEIQDSIHAQFFRLGQSEREIGRRYGMRDEEVREILREVNLMVINKARRSGFVDGRRSLLTSYAQKAGMN